MEEILHNKDIQRALYDNLITTMPELAGSVTFGQFSNDFQNDFRANNNLVTYISRTIGYSRDASKLKAITLNVVNDITNCLYNVNNLIYRGGIDEDDDRLKQLKKDEIKLIYKTKQLPKLLNIKTEKNRIQQIKKEYINLQDQNRQLKKYRKQIIPIIVQNLVNLYGIKYLTEKIVKDNGFNVEDLNNINTPNFLNRLPITKSLNIQNDNLIQSLDVLCLVDNEIKVTRQSQESITAI